MQIKQYSPTDHKIKALIYGEPGTGKTSLWGTAPNPIFASAEGWLLSIAHLKPNYVDIKKISDLRELLQYLKTQPHNYETVIIDSMTEINEIIKSEIQKKSGKQMQLQDWGTLANDMRAILRGFRDLDMHVIFIALATYEKDGDKIEKIVPSLNGKAANEIAAFMDVVGFITIEANGERKIICNNHSKTLSKDRTRLIGNDTEPDFSVWVDKVKSLDTIDEENVVYETPVAEPEIPLAAPTGKAAPGKSQGSTTQLAKKAPAAKISDKQIAYIKDLIEQLGKQDDTPENIDSRLRATFKQVAEFEIKKEVSGLDNILALSDINQAKKVIDFLVIKVAEAKKAMEEENKKQEEAPKKSDAEMVADLNKKKAWGEKVN